MSFILLQTLTSFRPPGHIGRDSVQPNENMDRDFEWKLGAEDVNFDALGPPDRSEEETKSRRTGEMGQK